MPPAGDKFYQAKIVQRTNFSEDLWSIRVDPGGPFAYQPGQYATLGVEKDGKLVERPYSIVSAPHEPTIEFFVELVTHGELTPLLHPLGEGHTLSMRKVAKGRFTLDTKSGRTNHLLICTVTGVAPFVSYVRSMVKAWKEGTLTGGHKLFLLEGASYEKEFGYRAELEKAAAEAPWLDYVSTLSRPWENSDWKGEVGRVDDLIRKYTDLWKLDGSTTAAYLCGNPDMIENGKGILKRRGYDKDAMKEEVYWIPGKDAE